MPTYNCNADNSVDGDVSQVANALHNLLNPQQNEVADAIIYAVNSHDRHTPKVFYLDGPGRSGKTFTYNYLATAMHAKGHKVLTAVWTGIAATLLSCGRTVHSLFKLPVPLLDTSCCNITPTSNYAAMLREVSLFIVDEASMVPLHAFNAIDRLLRDITGIDIMFGGKVFLWGGDFRQVLPVVQHAHPIAIIEKCIKRPVNWSSVTKFHLTTNMRVNCDEVEFSVLKLGNNEFTMKSDQPFEGCIAMPDRCVTNSVVTSVFGDVFDKNTSCDIVPN